MHSVHVSHLNTLAYGLATDAPPEKGLHSNDRLDIRLEQLLHFLYHRKEGISEMQSDVDECLHHWRRLDGCHGLHLNCLGHTVHF